MKILFVDSMPYAYDTTTPLRKPLGGTQSAVAYLSAELVRSGHEVVVINGVREPIETDGVRFLALPQPIPFINGFDVVVIVGNACGLALRSIGCTRPFVLWCHHATNQPAVQPLLNPEERAVFAGYAMVSRWQAEHYVAQLGVPVEKMQIMRNAAAPAFLKRPPRKLWFERGIPPVLGYTSTPYRGLDVLLLSFPSIRAKIPGARLRVFSAMQIYSQETRDPFGSLYDVCRDLPGVDYVGPVTHPDLAEAMDEIDILAYPSTFAETSCICAIEALTAGSLVIAHNLAALPETSGGFAHLVDLDPKEFQHGQMATRYASALVGAVENYQAQPEATLDMVKRQVEQYRATYNWSVRAAEWSNWLSGII